LMDSLDRSAKTRRTLYQIGITIAIACAAMWLAVSSLRVSRADAAVTPKQSYLKAQAVLDRFNDPIVITGTRFPALVGVPLNELVAYAYRGGEWTPIPFQIDEVNISGTYVTHDDGLLGGRDELVFMGGDAGESAGTTNWPIDAAARLNPRYAITVTDPLSTSQRAWAYLYRSPTLARSTDNYITWTYATQTASAMSYTAAFSPTSFVGLSDLSINGRNVDILDRQKLRLATLFTTLNEETIVTLLGPATITLPVAGPVRAATNSGDLRAAFYGSRLDFDVTFNLGALPLTVNSIRTSFDWISPTISGIRNYYDSNTPGGVAIDGVPDAISTTPRINWFQVNGDAVGPGGLVMAIPRLNPQGGTVTTYYKDNGAIDATDTGDKRSFGDAGPFINNPGTIVSLTLVSYILPPGADTNVGAAYYARATNPLLASAAQQNYPFGPPITVTVTGATVTHHDDPQTYVANVNPTTVTLPMTYVWQATDHSPITVAGDLSSSIIFTWTTYGLKDVSVTAYNIYGLASSDPLPVLVGRSVFLPLILKDASF
ncbi:MAG TPA: hypothetical protein VMP08_09660, partial [Anaerolineae bacterium]|nr:hypothetical protein [Anaerolineae bacterium]